MVQHTQPSQSEQAYVTDGHHVYHYNEHLAELVARGDLKYCDRPLVPMNKKRPVPPNEPIMQEVQNDLAGGIGDNDEDSDGKPAP